MPTWRRSSIPATSGSRSAPAFASGASPTCPASRWRTSRRARARMRGHRGDGPRPHRVRQLLQRRAHSELRVGALGEARGGQRGGDGRQHRLHELPARPVDGERNDPHRCREDGTRRRRGMDLAVHGLAQPQRGRAVRRRLRSRGPAGRGSRDRACSRRSWAAMPMPGRSSASAAAASCTASRATSRTATRCGTSTARRSSSARSPEWASPPSRRSGAPARSPADIDLVVPHQANLRIIEFIAKRAGIGMDRVFLTVHKYGNMSAATVPVALVEALESGRVHPGDLLLTPAFGGGLTFCSHVIRWGERVTPLGESDVALPPCDRSALDIVRDHMQRRDPRGRSRRGPLVAGVRRRRAHRVSAARAHVRAGACRHRRVVRVRPRAGADVRLRSRARRSHAPYREPGRGPPRSSIATCSRACARCPSGTCIPRNATPLPRARRSTRRPHRRTSMRWRRGSASRCRRRIARFSRPATA